jgi:cysteine desulfurase
MPRPTNALGAPADRTTLAALVAPAAPDGAYLDHAATTPLRPEAFAAMEPFLRQGFGNASGVHAASRAAKTALESAREVLAAHLGCEPGEVVFTSGGTESDNLAVLGAARPARASGSADGVVVSAVEHHAVLNPAERLAREGFRLREVAVTAGGVVDLDALAAALDEWTAVVSVMAVNSEVGTEQPLARVAEVVRARAPRAVLHTDAVQAVPWIDVGKAARDADLVSVSGHKFGGPTGVGALVVRRRTHLQPILEGGGQERGLRSGTANVAGIVGMAAALAVTASRRVADVARIAALRDRLAAGLLAAVPEATLTGDRSVAVAGNCHLTFPKVEAESLLLLLDRDGVYAAAGSACQSGSLDPSHVLLAMGMNKERALSSIRLTLGWTSTDADVDRALAVIPPAVERLRGRARR